MGQQQDIGNIKKALDACKVRRAQFPDFTILQSIEQQLLYILALLEGTEINKSRLKEIILGVYAVREFMETDSDFAQLLVEANSIAKQLSYA